MTPRCAKCGQYLPSHPHSKLYMMDSEYAVLKDGKTLQIAVSTVCKGCGTKTTFVTEVDFDSMKAVVNNSFKIVFERVGRKVRV